MNLPNFPLSIPAYYDLENFESDLHTAISLTNIAKLAKILEVDTAYFFNGEKNHAQKISSKQLTAKIQLYLKNEDMSPNEFDAQVGFSIAPSLSDPSRVLTWNVDCLRCACARIGVDWLDALP